MGKNRSKVMFHSYTLKLFFISSSVYLFIIQSSVTTKVCMLLPSSPLFPCSLRNPSVIDITCVPYCQSTLSFPPYPITTTIFSHPFATKSSEIQTKKAEPQICRFLARISGIFLVLRNIYNSECSRSDMAANRRPDLWS